MYKRYTQKYIICYLKYGKNFKIVLFVGAQIGTVICMCMCGFLASSKFGWPAIFYSLGFVSVIFASILYLFVADSPASHKSISIEEKLYIQSSLGQVNVKQVC